MNNSLAKWPLVDWKKVDTTAQSAGVVVLP